MQILNIGTLNTQGCQGKTKILSIARDTEKYNVEILGLTETHVKNQHLEEVKGIKKVYNLYHNGIKGTNKYSGVGLLINKDINATFQRITDRICVAEIDLEGDSTKKKLFIIVAYAPTLGVSEKNPNVREEFYRTLTQVTLKVDKSRHMIVTIGDFNAKTGSGYRIYPENMGKYGKGLMNSNGEYLLEYTKEFDLYLTNTTFPHRMCYRTTWTGPQRNRDHHHHDGTIRRNPYRNQIDYILTKNKHNILVQNSRSYAGFETPTDHKFVIAKFKMQWWKMKSNVGKIIKIDIDKFNEVEKREAYKRDIIKDIDKLNEVFSTDDKWKCVTDICKNSAKQNLGQKKSNQLNIHDEPEIKALSDKQKQLKLKCESASNKNDRKAIKRERNKTLNEIKIKISVLEEEKMEMELQEIENNGQNQKAYEAVKMLKKRKPKKKLKVFDENGNMCNTEHQQVKILTGHFKNIFEKENQEEPTSYPPSENRPPFSLNEIKSAVKRLKNGKSPGVDDMNAEMLKHAPDEVHKAIAEILNKSVETDDYLKLLKIGILTPLQKPPKKGMEKKNNVRPITLLPIIRKILAMCVIERTWEKLKHKIPKDQAAYQKGRSTTEQVFALKTLVEKAITSQDYNIIITMIDMSAAFDTVSRSKLMKQLETILEPHEIRMMHLLITDVKLMVRIGKTLGVPIDTNIGVAQGDCLSALLFIFYLAHIIGPISPETNREDHDGEICWSDLDWLIERDVHKIALDPKYADDITFIRSHQSKMNKVKRVLPEMLADGNLQENKTKREEYVVPGDHSWKNCKCLGSLLDTETDIVRRKGLAISTINTLQNLFHSHKLKIKTKIRIFEAYVSSVFLYNSELWVLDKTLCNKIDSFHRRMLRKVLNIKWPNILKNDEVYRITNVVKWSEIIRKRRLSWLGHLLRLDENTPARIALREACKVVKGKIGRHKLTWIELVKKDFRGSRLNLDVNDEKTFFNQLAAFCNDRIEWNKEIKHMMLNTTNM